MRASKKDAVKMLVCIVETHYDIQSPKAKCLVTLLHNMQQAFNNPNSLIAIELFYPLT